MINFPGPDKLILLAVIALVVLGPTRLPQAARTAGRVVGELRKLSARLQEEMRDSFGEQTDTITSAVGDLRNQVGSLRDDLTGFVRPLSGMASGTSGSNGGGSGRGDTVPKGAVPNGAVPDGAVPDRAVPSAWSEESVAAGTGQVGGPRLPPVPDDPSLN